MTLERISIQDQIKNRFSQLSALFDRDNNLNPIFQSQDNLQANELDSLLSDFIQTYQTIEVKDAEYEFFADLMQKMIPVLKQKEMGQVYTPPPISKFMAALAIKNSDALVLDPAAGCGTFLREIYSRLKEIKLKNSEELRESKKIEETLHTEIIKQVWGVEINAFPAQLCRLNLSNMNKNGMDFNAGVINHDFLALDPSQSYENYAIRFKIPNSRKIEKISMPQKFDVIVGNPPYIKQEKIPNKKNMMKSLPLFASARSNQKFKLNLTGKTDYYGFFIWYSTFFLKNNGILCFIVPNKWMDVKYGEKLKDFLKENYKIKAIIGFNKNSFKLAQVSTLILYLQKEPNEKLRKSNLIHFINITHTDEQIHLQTINNLLDSKLNSNDHSELDKGEYLFHNKLGGYQHTLIKQEFIDSTEKWSFKYLLQSKLAKIILKHDLIPMDNQEVTKVVGGIKTGANDFYFPSQQIISEFKIEKQYLQPGIKSGRLIPKGYVVDGKLGIFLSIPASQEYKETSGIFKFIKYCETNKKYHLRPSVKWKPWYSIPPESQDCPDILFLRHIDKSFKARWNKNHSIVSDGVRGLTIYDPDHLLFYLGICNSTFFYWQAHICGRWEGQGDLQLLVYELRKFLLPDIRVISTAKRNKVEKIMGNILTRESLKTDTSLLNFQHKLDLAVLDCMGLIDYYDLLISETKSLEKKRLTKRF
jgi:type I restriction-modification system DNA methylase subunit